MADHNASSQGDTFAPSGYSQFGQDEVSIRDNDSTMGDSIHPSYAPSEDVDLSDYDYNDNDSAMGDSVASSTVSMTSSIAHYEHEHGRRYHAYRAGRYFQPNDQQEQDLMDTAHLISLEVQSPLFGQLRGQPLCQRYSC